MAKDQRLKSDQIVTLFRQIDVFTTNGKTLAQTCKEGHSRAKLLSLAQDLWRYEGK